MSADPTNSGANLPSPEQWAGVRALVEGALDLEPAARVKFLDATCQNDAQLRDQVERFIAAGERAEDRGFLATPASDLVTPMLDATPDPLTRLNVGLAGRYTVERELASGGMATVYVARDLRHERDVAIKVLSPELAALLGAERFLNEIKTTAALQHPFILPLFDSGTAEGLIFYVMPLVEGDTLRSRLARGPQMPIDDAIRMIGDVAGALDYAHRQGVVHRDIKPENILLHEGRPLIADFGIALAIQSADSEQVNRSGLSLGTPPYMSPEQAVGSHEIDGRSDVYSLATVFYELLTGSPPFTGGSSREILSRIVSEAPVALRAARADVPEHVETAVSQALSKRPHERQLTAGEFARMLAMTPDVVTVGEANASTDALQAVHSKLPNNADGARVHIRWLIGGLVTLFAAAIWMAVRPEVPAEIAMSPHPNLIDQAILSAVTITPDGRALLYTGTAESGRPLMILPIGGLDAYKVPNTSGAATPFIAGDGRRVLYTASPDGELHVGALDSLPAYSTPGEWRYGSGAWDGDSTVVTDRSEARGLVKEFPGKTPVQLTRPDSAHGELRHFAPLVLTKDRAVVFTINPFGGRGVVTGPLAMASLDPTSPTREHERVGVEGRRAIGFVEGWLLYIHSNGSAIMAVRLDIERQRTTGTPVSVLEDRAGDIETAAVADNGALLYVRRPKISALVRVDTNGKVDAWLPEVTGRFMYPRLSPTGDRIAVQAEGNEGRNDLWVVDIATRTPYQLTTTGKALHPSWRNDGKSLVFMAAGGRGLMSVPVDASSAAVPVPGTEGGFGPNVAPVSDVPLYQRSTRGIGWRVWTAGLHKGETASELMDDKHAHYMPAVSPDGHWLLDVSNSSGKNEIYVRPFPGPGAPIRVSSGGGTEPAWSHDGRAIYYRGQGQFNVVSVTSPGRSFGQPRALFKDDFDGAMPHRNYDVMPDGSGFLMITGGSSDAIVVLNWVNKIKQDLKSAK